MCPSLPPPIAPAVNLSVQLSFSVHPLSFLALVFSIPGTKSNKLYCSIELLASAIALPSIRPAVSQTSIKLPGLEVLTLLCKSPKPKPGLKHGPASFKLRVLECGVHTLLAMGHCLLISSWICTNKLEDAVHASVPLHGCVSMARRQYFQFRNLGNGGGISSRTNCFKSGSE